MNSDRRRKSDPVAGDSRIPLPRPRTSAPAPSPFRRSNSLRLKAISETTDSSESGGTRGPWRARPLSRHRSLSLSTPTPLLDEDDDAASLQSFGSACSAMSCDHVYFARNGTTFSGRQMKYVVHCSPHAGETDEYLTPTQRATRQIRRLKTLLQQTQKDLEQKDQDIFRLTKEVVELRLFKASLTCDQTDGDGIRGDRESDGEGKALGSSPVPSQEETRFKASDAKTSSPSLADSGHFEDLGSAELEKRLQDLQHSHIQECQDLKEKHNDRVDSLLQRLGDVNNRYCELRVDYDHAQDKIRQLERDNESLRKSMEEHEERHKNMYLKMYLKGQEAARFEHADQVLEFASRAPGRVSVPELLQQLQVTEQELENIKAMYRRIVESRAQKGELDPEITLQFLKSAIYYFLTDKENHQGHLNAIASILGYNESERINIERAQRMYPRK
ncbi:protein quick-to-court isoform X2 [Anabrus simplex]|uniref:protein quick-to-court isoform X2 n=1 Tax=Anabrus simplex TaxID=316456 RepID=UPI0035A2CBFA